jgi:hypothetical protein
VSKIFIGIKVGTNTLHVILAAIFIGRDYLIICDAFIYTGTKFGSEKCTK